ncbi:hypothetical protein B0J14DRAFT_684653 [Halenospora varia]|nr:hypothetical protein B0J14DRAFT_684653 [Halenospora varia]
MASQSKKKQKTTSTPRVVAFSIAELEPDVLLNVFDRVEFHVHSALLKLHSAFFPKFLDSPDKIDNPPSTTGFVYEWITKIDDDGDGWHLISKPDKGSSSDTPDPAYKGDQSHQEKAFENLLSAIYNEPYEIEKVEMFRTMTSLADYCCALRAMSRSLDCVCASGRNRYLYLNIMFGDKFVLEELVKLRHPQLFHDAVIRSLGPWNTPAFLEFKNRALKQQCERLHGQIGVKIAEAQRQILETIDEEEDPAEKLELSKVVQIMASESREGEDGEILLPFYYRKLYSYDNVFEGALTLLMENCLQLCDNSEYEVIQAYNKDYFFCVDIYKEDYPWDTSKKDW